MSAKLCLTLAALTAALIPPAANAQTQPSPPPNAFPSFKGPIQATPPQSRFAAQTDFYNLVATSRPLAADYQYSRVARFADCAAKVSPSLSAKLLATDPRSGEAGAVSRQLRGISRGCLSAGSYVPNTFFRPAVAEALYRRAGIAPSAATQARPASVRTVAECVYVQSPQSVDLLLKTQPGSKAERGVLNDLAVLSRNCVVGGRHFDIAGAQSFLRSGLAEVAYHSVVEKSAPTPG